MYHVILCCEWGASTSLLVEKMQKAVKSKNLEIAIQAISVRDLDAHLQTGPCDMIMLGPQVGYKFRTLQNRYADIPVKLIKIPSEDYALLNGENVVELIQNEMNQ